MVKVEKLASAIYNDIVGGLRGYHNNFSMSLEQLQEDVVITRLQVIKEYALKGVLPVKDLLIAINCVDVDCKDLDRCKCHDPYVGKPVAHFIIPQLFTEYDIKAIEYIGSTDRLQPYLWSTSPMFSRYFKYRKRGKDKPFVYIDTTPNENGYLDGYIFNAPLIDQISIVAVFKDPRQLKIYKCCNNFADDNLTFIDNEVIKRVTESKIRYYRQMAPPILPNNQEYAAG